MKNLAIVLLVIAFMIPLRADILINGNFADGRAHWKGDEQDLDTSSDISKSSPPAGVIIALKKESWTKIYQSFTTREKMMRYTITFSLSSDYQPDPSIQPAPPVDGVSSPTPGLGDIPGVPVFYANKKGEWMLIIAQTGHSSYSFPLQPDVKKTDFQTFSGELHGTGDNNTDMNLVFAFPPGEGTITITNISLTPYENSN